MPDDKKIRSAHWAIQAEAWADLIEHQTNLAKARGGHDEEQEAAVEDIGKSLASIRKIATWRWQCYFSLVDQWRGTSIGRAYHGVHAADILLVQLLSPEHLEAKKRSVVADARTTLDPDDPRLLEIDRLIGSEPNGTIQDVSKIRASLQEAMRIAYTAHDQRHVRVRQFRNLLLCSAAVLATIMGALVALLFYWPDAVSFCFNPPPPAVVAVVEPGTKAPQPYTVCPSGNNRGPSSADVLSVAGIGAVGGALAAAFSILRIRGTSTFPYQVPIATAVLKIPSGALTGVVGIILLGGHFVPGFSELDEQRQILAYTLVFGYAQQLATRFVDDQAHSLHASVPSDKNPDSRQERSTATR